VRAKGAISTVPPWTQELAVVKPGPGVPNPFRTLAPVNERGDEMAHEPASGVTGNPVDLAAQTVSRRRLRTPIDTTTALLRDDSPKRRAVTAAQWRVVQDGREAER
jgi:hypothetical protein